MVIRDRKDALLLCGAFHRAWVSLLLDERITLRNVEETPSLLLGAILDVHVPEHLNEKSLAEAGLKRFAEFEKASEDAESVAVN